MFLSASNFSTGESNWLAREKISLQLHRLDVAHSILPLLSQLTCEDLLCRCHVHNVMSGGGGLLFSDILSTRGSACSSLCNSEASRKAISIATAISKALEYFSFASESKRFWICISWRPQTNLSRNASLRFAPKLQWVASFRVLLLADFVCKNESVLLFPMV